MSDSQTPTSKDVLDSLDLLRSDNPADRQRAIAILAPLREDPRVQQVFDHLYENDPDPHIRDLAWRAINQSGPSIPAPVQAPPAPVLQTQEAQAVAAPRARLRMKGSDSSRSLFLLNPANAGFLARESKRQRPRRVAGCLWLLLGLALAVVALLLAVWIAPDWYDWYRLERDGVEVEGIVTGRRVADEVGRGEDHYLRYSFTVPLVALEGLEVEDAQAVTSRDYAALEDGDPVKVTYLLDDPDVSRIAQDDPLEEDRYWMTALLVALVALTFIALGMAFRRRKRNAARLIKGQVVACTGMPDSEGDFMLKLRYRFHSPEGNVIVRQATQIRNDLKSTRLPEPGTPVAIYYRNDRSYRIL